MEWVETTGKTLDEAKEAALDQLGVDEVDAEFEVLDEPRAGLFGRVRGEARVRARVRPTVPRPKEDRRERRRRARAASGDSQGDAAGVALAESNDDDAEASDAGASLTEAGRNGDRTETTRSGTARGGTTSAGSAEGAGADLAPGPEGGPSESANRRRKRRRGGRSGAAKRAAGSDQAMGGKSDGAPAGNARPDRGAGRIEGEDGGSPGSAALADAGNSAEQSHSDNGTGGTSVEVSLDEQGRVAEEFLKGLASEFGLDAAVKVTSSGDEEVRLDLSGRELGLLIGPKGATLLAIQDLTRTVVHHQTGASNGRVLVDVGAYRQKRSEALARFAQQVAAKVKETGAPAALEPMAAPDRKVVHDAITDIEGVATFSEGEEPRRRVVIAPAGASSS
jgi:spoIIIJ-associated protein